MPTTSLRRRPRALAGARKSVLALALALAVACSWSAADANAAASIAVTVTPPTPGTPTAPQPVSIGLRADLPAPSGSTAPALTRLAVALPEGFTTTLSQVPSCLTPDFKANGSAACPATSRLGAGSASFVYIAGGLRIPASTDELVLFHGARSGTQSVLYLYLKISRPASFSLVVPGTIDDRPSPAGPLVTFDLAQLGQIGGGGSVSVTRAAFDVQRALAAGLCPATGRWTFAARLEYAGGGVEQPTAVAACAPDTTKPTLRASAKNGTPKLGARLPIRLSEPAKVRVTLERRKGSRWVRVKRQTFDAPSGSSTLRIKRATGGGRLARGSYRARLKATDAAGLSSSTRTVTFRLR
jgi:hypothetical protein